MHKKLILSCCIFFFIIPLITYSNENVIPLRHVHSHNDYLRRQPLVEALSYGFCSVEADIHIVNGDLLVAHDLDKCKPDKNLINLYLKPLFEQIRNNMGMFIQPHQNFGC